ncbi:MAG: hypothetical protein K2P81_03100 [Bacteriovoracaceae bacterium]|nr:hypothetical protein [Bacteriovoracaceae bacterium]
MIIAALALGLFSNFTHAQMIEDQFRQLTQSEAIANDQERYDDSRDSSSSKAIRVAPQYCEQGQILRRQPKPNYPEIVAIEKLCHQSINVDNDGNVVGFEFTNETQNRVNPRTAENGSERVYRFLFPLRHSQNIHISLTENAGIAGLMSHDLLETTIVLLPRKVIPSMESMTIGNREIRRIQLNTSETIDMDAGSGEIVEGVLVEAPMDMNPSRHARRFAGLNYTGRGLMIRVDRRAGTPEHIYTQAFNQNERIKEATVTYRGKTCYVPKDLIFANATNPDLGAYLLYANDQDFLQKVINPKCGWKLSLADLE